MTIRASRGVRLLVVAAMAWLGLALCAQAAYATHGRLQIVKVNQGGNPNDSFTFHPTLAPSVADFSLTGGGTSPIFEVNCNIDRVNEGPECSREYWPPPTLAVTEQPTSGYTLTDITCRYTQGDTNNNLYAGQPDPTSPIKPGSEVVEDLANGSVNLKIHYDEWVVCYFTNTYTATPAVADSSSPAVQPQIEVSPARVRPGTARVSGTSGCATSDVAVARVSGRRIVKVSFYVDTKKVKTLNKANRGNQWVLSVRLHRLAYGTHRVQARVEFSGSSQTKAKTLPLSFSRCRSSAVRPQFTG